MHQPAQNLGYVRNFTNEKDPAAARMARTGLGAPEGLINRDHGAVGGNTERPALREILPAVRPGETLPVTKPDRIARPYPMLKNIIEDMTRGSQAFRLPTGMNMRV